MYRLAHIVLVALVPLSVYLYASLYLRVQELLDATLQVNG